MPPLRMVLFHFFLRRFDCGIAPTSNNSSGLILQIDHNRTIRVVIELWRTGRGTIRVRLRPECLLVNRLHGVAQLVIDIDEGEKGHCTKEIILGPSQVTAVSLTKQVRSYEFNASFSLVRSLSCVLISSHIYWLT